MLHTLIVPYLLLSLTLSPNLTIHAEKVEKGAETPREGALLSPSSWLLLRSYFGEGERCAAAVEVCASNCEEQLALIMATCGDREKGPEDQLLIQALNVELHQTRENLEAARASRERWKWIAVGVSSVALTAGGAAWLYSRAP